MMYFRELSDMDLKGNDEIIKTFNENLVGGRQPEIQYCRISYTFF